MARGSFYVCVLLVGLDWDSKLLTFTSTLKYFSGISLHTCLEHKKKKKNTHTKKKKKK